MTPDIIPFPDPEHTSAKKIEAARDILSSVSTSEINSILSETRTALNNVLARHPKVAPKLVDRSDVIFQETDKAGEKVAKIPHTVTFSPEKIRGGFKELLDSVLTSISPGLNEDVANVLHTSTTFQAVKKQKENSEPPKPPETEPDKPKPTPTDGTDGTKKPDDKPAPAEGGDDAKKPEDKKPDGKEKPEDREKPAKKHGHEKKLGRWATVKNWVYKNTWERANNIADFLVNKPLQSSGPFASPLNFINFSSDKFWLWRLLGMKKDNHDKHGGGHDGHH
ncbi:MAG TPA: hypothetical protein VHA78_05655 [Candidatus Peribacteraceae bacterium]|nr:hypothetical protein [Candidatus Peribacteraceae bacterium]